VLLCKELIWLLREGLRLEQCGAPQPLTELPRIRGIQQRAHNVRIYMATRRGRQRAYYFEMSGVTRCQDFLKKLLFLLKNIFNIKTTN
jgi:translation initiation factor 1 (eIF-1/SUI1)